jgi:ethanolamine utilization protein EutQ
LWKEAGLPTHIERPTRIQAAGNMPKIIDEYIGRVNRPGNAEDQRVSVAHMRSPAGWQEPGQTPEFEEYTLVLRGRLRVRHKGGTFDVAAGQAVIAHPGEWIQYSTPDEATEYIAICLPAFSPQTVHRDDTP